MKGILFKHSYSIRSQTVSSDCSVRAHSWGSAITKDIYYYCNSWRRSWNWNILHCWIPC